MHPLGEMEQMREIGEKKTASSFLSSDERSDSNKKV
jgi:hypothetical protein